MTTRPQKWKPGFSQISEEQREFNDASRLVEQRQQRARKPATLSRLIPSIIASTGIGNEIANEQIGSAWKQTVDKELLEGSIPGNIRRGTLEVTVANSMIHQQMVFEQDSILRGLKRILPDSGIGKLRFRVDPGRFSRGNK